MDPALKALFDLVKEKNLGITGDITELSYAFALFFLSLFIIPAVTAIVGKSRNWSDYRVVLSVFCFLSLMGIGFYSSGLLDKGVPEIIEWHNAEYAPKIQQSCELVYEAIKDGKIQWYHKDAVQLITTNCDAERLYALLPAPAANH